eukprot:TRINITY_DN12835_c0_g6_i5.p1 TRINITY_DN12835_c0_g6~~TRINITY_DN12835_c0_g6_i5.p1  ORF type:complete len:331 (-),score=94.24 TRINITY_DN12835_c0_g6_i5:340-1332(-)
MVLQTRVTEMLGIKHPIIQGGMHYVGYAELAAAVSNAGGLGMITALTQPSAEDLRKEIRKCKGMLNPGIQVGVNLTLLPALSPPDYPSYARVVVEEGIKIVETAGASPEEMIKALKSQGIIIIHKCVAIRHALSAIRYGADIISMDGFECGGHPGNDDVGNMVLLPRAAKTLGVPFLASGGIADGKQLAAALALGCDGINMGTRFMATVEAPIHDGIKKALVDTDERGTMHVMRSVNNTERVFRNPCAIEVAETEAEFPGEFDKIGHLVKGLKYRESFQHTGNTQDSVWSCGQSIGLIDDVPTCQVLIDTVVAEAESIITNRLAGIVSKL